MKHGQGILRFTTEGGFYEGGWEEGLFHGKGKHVSPSGHIYEGEHHKGKRQGHGIFTWPDGSRYEGGFKNGKRHGRGVYFHPEGAGQVEADYENGKCKNPAPCAPK